MLKQHSRHPFIAIVVAVLVFGGAVVLAQVASVSIKFEAEAGSRSGQTAVASDSTASGGSFLNFTTATGTGGLPYSNTFETAADFAALQKETVFGLMPTEDYSWPADHDASCNAPPTTHPAHLLTTSEHEYWCPAKGSDSGHIHTTMRFGGFGLVSFSPNQAFNNIHKVCWDMTMTNMGGRRWPQIVVVNDNLYQANGRKLSYSAHYNGAIGESNSFGMSDDTFLLLMLTGSTAAYTGPSGYDVDFAGFTNGADKIRRFHHCITDNENGTVTIQLERATTTDTRTLNGALPNGNARVIFEDYGYNPPKDEGTTPDPNTMHWDNISIQ